MKNDLLKWFSATCLWPAMVACSVSMSSAGQFSPDTSEKLEPRAVFQVPIPEEGGNVVQIPALDFSNDGKRLLTASTDQKLRLWDIERGEVIQTMEIGSKFEQAKVAFSEDEKSAYVACVFGDLLVFDLQTGQLTKKFPGSTTLVEFSPDGKMVAISGINELKIPNPGLGIFEMPSGKLVCKAETHPEGGAPHTVSFSANGEFVAVGTMTGSTRPDGSVHQNPHIFVFSTKDGNPVANFRHDPIQGSTKLSPDGSQLASISQQGELRFFDVTKGKESQLPALTGVGLWYELHYSPDGRYLVVGAGDTLKFFDATTGKQVGELLRKNRHYWAKSLALTKDGSILAQAIGSEIRLWPIGFGESPKKP